jgi:hypothetical protein
MSDSQKVLTDRLKKKEITLTEYFKLWKENNYTHTYTDWYVFGEEFSMLLTCQYYYDECPELAATIESYNDNMEAITNYFISQVKKLSPIPGVATYGLKRIMEIALDTNCIDNEFKSDYKYVILALIDNLIDICGIFDKDLKELLFKPTYEDYLYATIEEECLNYKMRGFIIDYYAPKKILKGVIENYDWKSIKATELSKMKDITILWTENDRLSILKKCSNFLSELI